MALYRKREYVLQSVKLVSASKRMKYCEKEVDAVCVDHAHVLVGENPLTYL